MYHRDDRLVLASASPRRAALLARAGYAFDVVPANVDESRRPAEAADAYVARLARDKAAAEGDEDGGDGTHVEPEGEADGLIERRIEHEGVCAGDDAFGAYRQPLDKPLEKPKYGCGFHVRVSPVESAGCCSMSSNDHRIRRARQPQGGV